MAEQNDVEKKKKSNRTSGILLIVLGIIGVSSRFILGRGDTWGTVDTVKILASVAVMGYGVYLLLKNKK
jgi:hypothetical protein